MSAPEKIYIDEDMIDATFVNPVSLHDKGFTAYIRANLALATPPTTQGYVDGLEAAATTAEADDIPPWANNGQWKNAAAHIAHRIRALKHFAARPAPQPAADVAQERVVTVDQLTCWAAVLECGSSYDEINDIIEGK